MRARTIAIAIAGTVVLGAGIATAGVVTGLGDSPARGLTGSAATTDGETAGTPPDVSGPCDEVEHAGDPACGNAGAMSDGHDRSHEHPRGSARDDDRDDCGQGADDDGPDDRGEHGDDDDPDHDGDDGHGEDDDHRSDLHEDDDDGDDDHPDDHGDDHDD